MTVQEIDVHALRRDTAHRTLIDVREPAEFAAGHVPGARNVPLAFFADHLATLATDPAAAPSALTLVCRSGNRSGAMAALAAERGLEVHTVQGGTEAWQAAGYPVERTLAPLVVRVIETPTLGNRTYLAHDGRTALVIDPQRDIDRVLAVLEEEGVRLTHVFETHVHNDYVTGGHALAAATGAEYLLNAEDEVSFQRTPVRAGEPVQVSPRMRITPLATPGHTFTHLSYALADCAGGADCAAESAGAADSAQAVGVFTGGSLLYGATGRPDLLGPDHTHTLARHQHHSVNHLADTLPASAAVWPTHGFGSFCSATPNDGVADHSTLAQEAVRNSALTSDEETWVAEVLAGLNAWPAYYAHMAPANLLGPDAPDLSAPAPADAHEIEHRLAAGEWVVDLRHRTVFAAGHAPGSLNFGLEGPFATYLGWLIDWDAPLTLLGESPEQVAQAQRELARIGIERPVAAATGDPTTWTTAPLASHPVATFADLAEVRHHREVTVLDVRRTDEFAAGHVEGALNVPLHVVVESLARVPHGEVWVHCAGGYRASVAASILARSGRQPVAIDDGFDQAQVVGLPLVVSDGSDGQP